MNGVMDQVYYLLTDHLGSTSVMVDVNGSKQAELRYAPWGTTRYAWGETPTDYKYTGQREEAEIGLYYYQSRFYDANLGRFSQPDSIIPEQSQGVQAWDRYAFVNNNPLMYTDPSGHCTDLADCMTQTLVGAALAIMAPILTWTEKPFSEYRDEWINAELTTTTPGSSPDITNWLVDTLNENASGPIVATLKDANSGGVVEKYSALVGWQSMVEPGAPWDYKVDFAVNKVNNIIIGGQEFSAEAVANITFGYLGRASGFSANTLYKGAGGAQAISDLLSSGTIHTEDFRTFFDQPLDHNDIEFGIYLYDSLGGKPLTLDYLKEAIGLYGDKLHPPAK